MRGMRHHAANLANPPFPAVQADLADKDFSAERGAAVVISTGAAVDALSQERDAAERVEAEARNLHRLRLPRRPAWTPDTTPEQLDFQVGGWVGAAAWRSALASSPPAGATRELASAGGGRARALGRLPGSAHFRPCSEAVCAFAAQP